MSVMTVSFMQDLAFVWKSQGRQFLDYITDYAQPVNVDEHDVAVENAFKKAHEEESDTFQRLVGLTVRSGINANRPGYSLYNSVYNFNRSTVIADAFMRIAKPELAELEAIAARYENATELEPRLLSGIASEFHATRSTLIKELEKALAAMQAAKDGGSAVVEEEEVAVVADGEFPWHNEDLSLDERMKLAEGKGLFEKLYAAMAQTDCTACGYDCEGYAQAIADGEDTDLTKCAPGELETQEMIEKLMGK